MKKIKYRAWAKDLEKMFPVAEIDFVNETVSLMIIENGKHIQNLIYSFENVILMQYTGLKDENGKEVCESDILKRETNKISILVVSWDEEHYQFRFKDTKYIHKMHCSLEYDTLIIGNIYENPELLEVKE